MTGGAESRWVGSMPEVYDRWLVPVLFRPFAAHLARRVGAFAPRRVLELAAGTGVLTSDLLSAAAPGEVTATDLSGAMVALGGQRAPGALWQQADALALPFPAAEYDVVACQFGVMFFPDKPVAFSEARRVLAPGGTLVMSIWDTVDTSDFAAAVVDGVHRLFPEDPPTFLESVPYAYADTDVVVSDLRAGGMDCVAVDSVTLQSTATAADVARGFCAGTPLRAQIEARGDLEATTAAVAEHVAARLGTGPVTGRMAAYVIEATPAAPSPGRRRAGADGP